MLNTVKKEFLKKTIEYYFEYPKDEIRIRNLILLYIDNFTDQEILDYNYKLERLREESLEILNKKGE